MPLPQISPSILHTKRDDEQGLCGGKPSTQIRKNKGSSTNPINVIILNSKIEYHLLKSYCTQFKTVKKYHVRNLSSCEFWPIKQYKLLQTLKQQQIWWSNYIFDEYIIVE